MINASIVSLLQKYGHKAGNLEMISGSTEERIQQILTITGL